MPRFIVHAGAGGTAAPNIMELPTPAAVEPHTQTNQPMETTPPSQPTKKEGLGTGPTPSALPHSKDKQPGSGALANGGTTLIILNSRFANHYPLCDVLDLPVLCIPYNEH